MILSLLRVTVSSATWHELRTLHVHFLMTLLQKGDFQFHLSCYRNPYRVYIRILKRESRSNRKKWQAVPWPLYRLLWIPRCDFTLQSGLHQELRCLFAKICWTFSKPCALRKLSYLGQIRQQWEIKYHWEPKRLISALGTRNTQKPKL